MRSDPRKRNPDFWCEFHNDHGNRTTDSRLLQGEVKHLLKQCYLTDLFSEKRETIIYEEQTEAPETSITKKNNQYMAGILPEVMTHKLNDDPSYTPVKKKKKKQASFKNQVIQDEVQKLLKIGLIREVKYPNWLANTVVVPKKNEK
ncbi:uncharacterized protein [Nicotiana tomentosiformis]|uniref:uncharacterized protein n=1 Tax=Nicotiana tomentosiformis TaxID=4098 RepID=UPI00388C52BB